MMKSYLELCKINLSLFSALSAATGYVLVGSGLIGPSAVTVAGVLFLACGASALNQYQERSSDALMKRTKARPLPSGRIKPIQALCFSILLLTAGLSLLIFSRSLHAVLLGVSAIILYNGVYTYLKKITAFASVPCAVIGALPPLIGWFAAEGTFPAPQILSVCLLFYMWQISHFWLLYLSHGDDYEKAGLPSLKKFFMEDQIVRIVFVWMLATAVAFILTPLYGLVTSQTAVFLSVPVTIWLVLSGIRLTKKRGDLSSYHFAFRRMNIFILLIMLVVNGDRLFSR